MHPLLKMALVAAAVTLIILAVNARSTVLAAVTAPALAK